MSDNPLKATIEAIAESDNERGGVLITRLREAHLYGRDDGAFPGGWDTLSSPADVFTAAMIGQELDIVINPAGTTGNEGRYRILATPTLKTAQLREMGGGVPVFAAENPVIWRFGTLRVESVYNFLNPSPPTVPDPTGRLWVGTEEAEVTYRGVTTLAGANTFDQLGDPLTGGGYLYASRRRI